MLIEHLSLTKVTSAILAAAGAPSVHADAVAEHLVEANLKGHDSHGIGMVPSYVKGMLDQHVDPHGHAQIIKDNGAIVNIDAGTGLGRSWVLRQWKLVSRGRKSTVGLRSFR